MGDATVSNEAASLVLVVLLGGVSAVGILISRRSALPLLLHNAVWTATLALVGSGLIEYHSYSIVAWGVLAIGLLFFNLGCWLGGAVGEWSVARSPLGEGARQTALLGRRSLLVLLGLYLLGFAIYLGVVIGRFGLETFLTNPEAVRGAQGVSYLESVPLGARLLLYIGPLILAGLVIPGAIARGLPTVWRGTLIVGLVASMIALLQRTNLFAAALWGIAALLVQPRAGSNDALKPLEARRHWRSTPIALVGLVGAIGIGTLVVFQLIGGALGKTGDSEVVGGNISQGLHDSGLTSPFIYLTAGTVAFLHLTSSTNDRWPPSDGPSVVYGDYNPQTWGGAFFEPVLSALPGVEAWNPVAAFVDVGTLTNVFTWLEPFYRDFREVGVGVGALLLGAFITYLHRTRHLSPARFWIGALAVSLIFLAPFVQMVNDTLYVGSAIIVLILSASPTARRRANAAPPLATTLQSPLPNGETP